MTWKFRISKEISFIIEKFERESFESLLFQTKNLFREKVN